MQRRAVSVISGILIFVSMIYAYGILQIQDREYTSNEISPTTFPWVLVALLVVLAISLFVEQWFGPARREDKVIEGGRKVDTRIIAAVFLLFLYIVSLQWIGFLWTTPFFLGFLSTLYGTRRLPLIAGMAVITTLTLYALLKYLFGVPVP
ncbi:MAG: tripartite tricarboxylate transporter TctB family protein [Deltaproteobacteria bacterium]|nr:tripartite tricarboxylate transporter TctB family protein [Deltaproteobacteria bacterium]